MKPKIVTKFSSALILGLVLVLLIIFIVLQKKSSTLTSDSPIIFKKVASYGECSSFCQRSVVLHENGLLELKKEDIVSKKAEEAKFTLSKNELAGVKDSISKSGILAKNCNVYGLMDASYAYQISLAGTSIDFEKGFDPKKANEKTDNCSADIDKIEEAIGHQDW